MYQETDLTKRDLLSYLLMLSIIVEENMAPLFYLLCYCLPLFYFYGVTTNFLGFLGVLFITFVVLPILDQLIGTRQFISLTHSKLKDSISKLILISWLPIQLLTVILGAEYLSSHNTDIIDLIVVSMASGVLTGGIGITIAHEFCHRKTLFDQTCSQFLLLGVCYMHFHIDHVVGHHRHVSTPKDPVTAKFGQSLYQFIPQSVFGSFKNAWLFEKRRLGSKIFPELRNRVNVYVLLYVISFLLIFSAFGMTGLLFFLIQSIFGIFLLETISYIVHYGLSRKLISHHRHESVKPHHSWNSDHLVSNFFLFKLSQHSHHHANAAIPYQYLESQRSVPQLPMGLPGMIGLALFPPVWRKVMHPRLESLG